MKFYYKISRLPLMITIRILVKDPVKRINLEEAMEHPFIKNIFEIEDKTKSDLRRDSLVGF